MHTSYGSRHPQKIKWLDSRCEAMIPSGRGSSRCTEAQQRFILPYHRDVMPRRCKSLKQGCHRTRRRDSQLATGRGK